MASREEKYGQATVIIIGRNQRAQKFIDWSGGREVESHAWMASIPRASTECAASSELLFRRMRRKEKTIDNRGTEST